MTSDTRSRLAGAAIGTALGALLFWLLCQSAQKASFTVAAGMSLGISAAARRRSIAWAVATGIAAVLLTILVEWLRFPFAADPSLGYFLRHLRDLSAMTQWSLLAMAAVGVYFGAGRNRGTNAALRGGISAP